MAYTTWLYVSNWQRQRRMMVEDNSIVLQVTLTCSHCSICSRRVSLISEALTKSGASWSWVEAPRDWPDVRCVRITRIVGENPVAQVRRQIGMEVSEG